METIIQKRLIATDKKYHQAPVYICAKEDPRTKELVDYESRLTEDERKKLTVKIDKELQLRVSHLMTFDVSNPNDKLYFEIITDDEMVAPSKEAVNPMVHRYYVEDKEHEAKQAISKTRLKAKAYNIVSELSLDNMVNYAKILGKYVKDLSLTQVEATLYQIVEDNPQSIIDVKNDSDLKYKIFLRRLLDNGIISVDNGKYLNGKDLMGVNESYAITWLKDRNNKPIIDQWGIMLDGESSLREVKVDNKKPKGKKETK